jgi:membrane fusion protein (multidrug efflux system)
MNRNILLATIGAAFLAGVALFVLERQWSEGGARAGGETVPAVVVAEVAAHEFGDILNATGTVRANESVAVTSTVEDRIADLHFEDGDRVEAGRALVTLESGEERARLQEARAVVSERERRVQRARKLVKRRATSRAKLEEEERLWETARARVAHLEARLRDYTIRAPFSGMLGFRRVSVGEVVDSETLLTTLDDITRVKVDFPAPEKRLAALEPGLAVTARSDAYPGRTFEGRVTTVGGRIDAETRSVAVRAVLDNPDLALKPGMRLDVAVDRPGGRGLAAPDAAVRAEGGRAFVFRVDPEGRVERRAIATGRRRSGRVEITAGVAAGDRLIVEGAERVRPGARVNVRVARENAGT